MPSETVTVELRARTDGFGVVNEGPPLTVKPPPVLAVELSASVKPPVSGERRSRMVRLELEAPEPDAARRQIEVHRLRARLRDLVDGARHAQRRPAGDVVENC